MSSFSYTVDDVERVQGSNLSTWGLALCAVCLRIHARRLSKAGLWYDDWLMIPAIVRIPWRIEAIKESMRFTRAHPSTRSLLRRYALSPQSGVSHPRCTESLATNKVKLTSKPLFNSNEELVRHEGV